MITLAVIASMIFIVLSDKLLYFSCRTMVKIEATAANDMVYLNNNIVIIDNYVGLYIKLY